MGIWKKVSASALALALASGSIATTTQDVSAASSKPSVTRGEYVKQLITSMGVELGSGSSITFKDVSKDLAPYVEKAVQLKLVNGKSATSFAPNDPLNREQAFVMAVRGIDTDEEYSTGLVKKFKDSNKISKSLLPEVSKGVGMGFLLGYADGTVKPGQAVTKGEMQAILKRFLKEYRENLSVSLRILGTTDLHTNIVNYDYYKDKETNSLGFAKTASLIKTAREENSNTLLIDNGDLIQGTPLGSYKNSVDPLEEGEVHPAIAALNLLDYDAATLGNHEFNYGLEYLEETIDDAEFDFVNANVIDEATGKNKYTPYVILDKKVKDSHGKEVTVKVGVTGIVPPDILKWDKSNLIGKVSVKDSVDAVTEVVPQMKAAGADVVVVLSHSGLGDDVHTKQEENVSYLITKIKDVNAVISGHAHQVFPGLKTDLPAVDNEKGTMNGVPIVMPGKYGSHLGVIDLKLVKDGNKWAVSSGTGAVRGINKEASTDVDQAVVNTVKEAHEGTINYVRTPIGEISSTIHSYFSQVQDDPSIQIVTTAQKWYVEQKVQGTADANLPILSAGAPFKAGTRSDSEYYTYVGKGEIAIKNVADLYLYDNTIATLKVTGADVKEWLEMSAGQFNQIDSSVTTEQSLINGDFRSYNYDVIDGVTYEIDVTQPAKYDADGNVVNANASRIKNLMYDGKPIDLDQVFLVATNNYRANGTFPGVKNNQGVTMYPDENRQAIIDYIIEKKVIDPSIDNNWKFAAFPTGTNIVFESSKSAKDVLAADSVIKYIGEGTDGFGKYSIK